MDRTRTKKIGPDSQYEKPLPIKGRGEVRAALCGGHSFVVMAVFILVCVCVSLCVPGSV